MKALIAAAALLLSLSSARAESIVAWATRAADDTGSISHVLKPLTNGGATSVAFTTHVNRDLVKITYTAECAVLGPIQSWLAITILVDGIEADPQAGTDFALCSSLGPAPNGGSSFQWTGAAKQSFYLAPEAGVHHVQIYVDILNGATEWWLGESSLAVEAQ